MKKWLIWVIVIVLLGILAYLIFGNWGSVTGGAISYASIESQGYKCLDSDGGTDIVKEGIFVKGAVTRISSNPVTEKIYQDACDSTNKLKEYSCTNWANVESGAYRCKNGCLDGACVR